MTTIKCPWCQIELTDKSDHIRYLANSIGLPKNNPIVSHLVCDGKWHGIDWEKNILYEGQGIGFVILQNGLWFQYNWADHRWEPVNIGPPNNKKNVGSHRIP